MRIPQPLISLVEQGIIEEVVRPLMSGKEAQVYLVVAHGEQRVAKIYKEATERSFKHRSEYTEGRKVRNTRDQRALGKRSRYGRSQQEESWRAAEADVIYRLRDAGVRVPEPIVYIDNVLVMELVVDGNDEPAPRLVDVNLSKEQAEEMFEVLVRDVVKMLCAGLVHGDLSEFNVLAGTHGTVIIDFPQSVDAASNRNARKLLLRDMGNLTRFFGAISPGLRSQRYAEEMWALYELGELTPEYVLTGKYEAPKMATDLSSLLSEMEAVEKEHQARRVAAGLPELKPVQLLPVATQPSKPTQPSKRSRRRNNRKAGPNKPAASGGRDASPKKSDAPSKPRRRRRRRPRGKRGGGAGPVKS